MSTSSDMRDAGWDLLLAVSGESVTITPDGGAGAAATVVWDDKGEDTTQGTDDEVRVRLASARVDPDDASSLTTRATFTRSGVVWSVEDVTHKGSYYEFMLRSESKTLAGGTPRIVR